jgi:hypothetical protein
VKPINDILVRKKKTENESLALEVIGCLSSHFGRSRRGIKVKGKRESTRRAAKQTYLVKR